MSNTVTRKRLKVLVQAYACEPGSGSEPGVGWYMCQAIVKDNDAWIITRKNNKAVIEKELALSPNPNLHFYYTDLPKWLSFWKKGGRGIRTYYYLWQFFALFTALKLSKNIRFDIAHHVTFVNDWLFSSFSLLPIPFIWGPIGSHPKAPRPLVRNLRDYINDRLRYGFQSFMRIIDPFFWICAYRSRLIIGISKEVGMKFPIAPFFRKKYISHTAIGVEQLFHNPANTHTGKNILSMGRLVSIKAFHLTIDAFNKAYKQDQTLRLTIVGKGPLKNDLENLINQHGIEHAVKFIDWLPRNEALEVMSQSDVFLFPSFEGGGMVVLEAMAHGIPVVCLDYGGPGEMAPKELCKTIPIDNYQSTVDAISKSIIELTRKNNKQSTMIKQWISDHYLWSKRNITINSWYNNVIK